MLEGGREGGGSAVGNGVGGVGGSCLGDCYANDLSENVGAFGGLWRNSEGGCLFIF